MQATTLFVLGLVAGALAVFGVRAASLEDATGEAHAASHEAHVEANHARHADPDAAPGLGDEHGDTQVSDHPPENLICPVMGNEVDPRIFIDYGDRRIGFCCAGCDEAFLADPEKYLKKVDAELAQRAKATPSTSSEDPDPDRPPENLICPVMGNEVDPTVYVDYQGRRIGFCCPGCDETFLADPEKYLKKVDAELRARGER